ncbi:protein split ends-like isoform X1 [Vespa crabro]|uniref:protein split ends-like isoform X1 n=1 Tax=Vespa crabro TaxID=7445 RepID=UPI001F01C4AD|nr:protein split ends-like isoform X1 [Vespa crabro]XP_046838369.1 protein split ends-like isoform X1 [Vespa crabro]
MSRRPSVSIYDYPEHLNPFNDDGTSPPSSHPRLQRENSKTTTSPKEIKHKFWTFGRSRKKRSNSFSIKSTWNGLFGKRKETDQAEKRSTIITVSSTYKREPFDRPIVPPRISKDQQEFDEALGTLVRRRKYTLDSGSRYSSSLTVNGDPARIYDGSPQDTTASIMGDLTPKAPARRFGQVSPRSTDKIPPLNFEDKESKENGTVTLREKSSERTPVPPVRRSGNRSSQRLNTSNLDLEEETSRSGDVTLRDENENVPEDYVFKRFGQDSVRRSNISINSCVSIGSTASGYGRKKRRAPQPPRRTEQLETPEESEIKQTPDTTNVELQITEPIDISRVTENIDEMTKRSQELVETSDENTESSVQLISKDETNTQNVIEKSERVVEESVALENTKSDEDAKIRIEQNVESEKNEDSSVEQKQEMDIIQKEEEIKEASDKETVSHENQTNKENDIDIEYCRKEEDKMEIIKDVNEMNSKEELNVCLRRKDSADSLSRSDSFSVQEEIKKIERQIQALESKNLSRDSTDETLDDIAADRASNTRLSILANRRHFFQNMVDNEINKDGVKIEFKELPREQKNIHVIKLTDSPVPIEAPKEPVKVIELHISEPIRQRPEILDDVNPIPKPRRHASLSHNSFEVPVAPRERSRNSEFSDKRGKSV